MAQVGAAVLHGKISVNSADHRNYTLIRSSCSYNLPRPCRRTNCRPLNLCGLGFQARESISLRLTCNSIQMRIGDLLYKRHFYPVCCRLGVRKWPPVAVFPRGNSREKTRKNRCHQGSGVLKETDHVVEASITTTGDDPLTEDGRTASVVDNRTGETVSGELAIPTRGSDKFSSERENSNAHDSTHDLEIVDEGRRPEVELKWYQSRVVNFVRPIVRVLNGAAFNRTKGIVSGSKDNQAIRFLSNIPKILSGAAPSGDSRRIMGEKLRQAEADFFTFTGHLGKYLFIMMATGAILATGYQLAGGNSQQETLLWSSWLAGIIIGSMIGAGKVMERRGRAGPRNIIITGSTRGLGKALAWEFLLAGDRVVVASRSLDSVVATVAELRNELDRKNHCSTMVDVGNEDFGSCRTENYRPKVVGMTCDVAKVEDVQALAEFAVQELGSIDIWINNAGVNKGFRPLVQFSDDDIQQIVSANLIGSLICTRQAIQVMKTQPKRGHVFNMDGAGSGGSSTPLTAVYGSTKCGLRQLHASLLKEYKRSGVGIHTASPGMVLTDLLLSGASLQNKKMFNIICELPETVARALVPRMRDVKGTGKSINYLTPPRILLALVTAWLRRGRWFDEEGRAVYAAETDRIRNWAEGRTRLPVSAAIDQFSDTTWVSVFSVCVICAFIMLSSSNDSMPGT